MTALRRFLFDHRLLAAGIVAFAMFLKALVPAGYMVGGESGSITIEICTGYGPVTTTLAIPGLEHHQDKSDHPGKEMPCAFSGLTAPSLACADPALLVLAIAFIVAAILRPEILVAPSAPAFLRPPLRGPPLHA